MQFVAGDGRPLGDVPLVDLNLELLQGVLEQSGIGKELFSGLGGGARRIRLIEHL